jgi:hypothetical protein
VSLGLNSDCRTQGLGGTFIGISQEKGNTIKSRGEGRRERKEMNNIFFVYLFYEDY